MYVAYATETMPHPLVPHSAVIQVSGYPAIAAMAWTNQVTGRVVVTTAADAVLNGHHVLVRAVRCRACHRPLPAEDLALDSGLGVDNLCGRCVIMYRAICIGAVGRLPRTGEFFCRVCSQLRPIDERLPVESDQRWRWRCRPCRREQCREPHARWGRKRVR